MRHDHNINGSDVVILRITSTKQKSVSKCRKRKIIRIADALVQDKSIDVKHKHHSLVRSVGVAIIWPKAVSLLTSLFSIQRTFQWQYATMLLSQNNQLWVHLVFVPHRTSTTNEYFAACLHFQLFGGHTSRTKQPTDKVELQQHNSIDSVSYHHHNHHHHHQQQQQHHKHRT